MLGLVRQGLANKQIARRLGISERTVKAHLTSAFARIGVVDRTQAGAVGGAPRHRGRVTLAQWSLSWRVAGTSRHTIQAAAIASAAPAAPTTANA